MACFMRFLTFKAFTFERNAYSDLFAWKSSQQSCDWQCPGFMASEKFLRRTNQQKQIEHAKQFEFK